MSVKDEEKGESCGKERKQRILEKGVELVMGAESNGKLFRQIE